MARRPKPEMTDDENPALDAADFAALRPARDVLPRKVYDNLVAETGKRARGQRGPSKRPVKVSMTIRVEPEVVERWRSSGKGWQSRARDLLAREAPKAKRQA